MRMIGARQPRADRRQLCCQHAADRDVAYPSLRNAVPVGCALRYEGRGSVMHGTYRMLGTSPPLVQCRSETSGRCGMLVTAGFGVAASMLRVG